MTTAQKLKVAEHELRQWRDRKHFLANGERKAFDNEIRQLKKKIASLEEDSAKLESYRNGYNFQVEKNAVLLLENKKLNKKIKYLHKWYKDIIKGLKNGIQNNNRKD